LESTQINNFRGNSKTRHVGHWMDEHVSVCQGVKRFDARERVITALMERNLFRGTKDHPMSLPICR